MTQATTTNLKAELAALRVAEDALFEQALLAPQDEMFNQFATIWNRRETLLKEIEMNITPMPSDVPLPTDTAKSVESVEPELDLTTCTLEEFLAIPKPGKWKYIRHRFIPPCWEHANKPGRYDALPPAFVKMYALTKRQIAILEGKIQVKKAPTKFTTTSQQIFHTEELTGSRMEGDHESYYSRISS